MASIKDDTVPSTPEEALARAIEKVGSKAELARRLELPRQNIQNWTKIPAEHVPSVSRATGMARYMLRPDLPELFPHP